VPERVLLILQWLDLEKITTELLEITLRLAVNILMFEPINSAILKVLNRLRDNAFFGEFGPISCSIVSSTAVKRSQFWAAVPPPACMQSGETYQEASLRVQELKIRPSNRNICWLY
jgi:hypothetical protein